MRTRVINPSVFLKVAQAVEKLSKVCLLKFIPEKIHFIVITDMEGGGVQVWSQINASSMFVDYRVESAHENEIYLEIQLEYLLRALKSCIGSLDVNMKLTKRDGLPTLSFTIANQSRTGKEVLLTQDIPIKVLTPNQMETIKEPLVPEPQVHIMMPPLLSVRTIVERMRNISDHVIVSANMNGEFTLRVESEAVQVETFYKSLINPELDLSQVDASRQPSLNRDPENFAFARIDIRNFIKFLHSYHVSPSNVVCCIIEDHALVLYVYVGGNNPNQDQYGVLTYYVPVKHL
ncbi:cell cycle checkpoint [Basidiobolus meristosporus CBS 931.73]|uniref:Checkpoint protein n=1 Tax=Basidiobolus meristosporus CBS 931.73 TaxID=1314790 RepID=A0A1Y1Y5Y9_9FUNG|nr:cell cycle checkpoint [Basidiobolus meristosporus CBS 931.73]|eukprot:ORX93116.1 cell cycle checkpoint [Basidiobolus meristosporus CBS 931.73]